MSSRSLLLVLLVLFYLQFFTTANNAMALYECCFKYQTHPIHARLITGYKETDQRQCPKPGVIFTLKRSRHMCADPSDKWVQDVMKRIDMHSFRRRVQPEVPDNPVPPPSTWKNKPDNPVPPPVLSRNKPVTITEPVSTASTNIEQPDNPVPSPSTSRNKPDSPVSTASTNTEHK
ncbi:hypothetical protein PGIGA_G00198150 [Pangasianodon gigas]|uniref:Uncharacterized protein n=1 Tax=Pangasianodon gigas TaxID=30993 RepID=A0ACC5WEB9_PANGG|nr:hypothetical protein [Pangasianodon gigas]